MKIADVRNPMSRAGLTLVEVLIAIAIIGIAFGVLALTQVTTMRVGADSQRASDTTEFANARLEAKTSEIRSNFSSILTTCTTPAACSSDIDDGSFQGTLSWGKQGSGYLEEGLIRLTASLVEPSVIEFSRVVSCIDVNPPPTVAAPVPCPVPVSP